MPHCSNFPKSNVWGLNEETTLNQPDKGGLQGKIASCDPEQPDSQFYHGVTPAFVIAKLVEMYRPEKVLDSMAGIGTTKYVCEKEPDIVKKIDQFDINEWEKGGVKKGDAENPPTTPRRVDKLRCISHEKRTQAGRSRVLCGND